MCELHHLAHQIRQMWDQTLRSLVSPRPSTQIMTTPLKYIVHRHRHHKGGCCSDGRLPPCRSSFPTQSKYLALSSSPCLGQASIGPVAGVLPALWL